MEFIDLVSQQEKIRTDIDRRIAAVLDHGRYVMGPEVAELEERLAARVGTDHCVAVSSGTDALVAALMALGIGPGDEVITVPYTFIATVEAIELVGAKTVFVDIDSGTWNMDPALLDQAITEKTRAIIPVGIYGQTADMTAVAEIAKRNGDLPVIEDAAQSFGATHGGKESCALSRLGCTSFFPSKPLGCYGDGGAVFTPDGELAAKLRAIRNHGSEGGTHRLLGFNGRLDSIQAAVLLSKLEIFDEEISMRQNVAARYRTLLEDTRVRFQELPPQNTSVFAQFTVLAPAPAEIRASLEDAGIPTMSYYALPAHLQPAFSHLGYSPGDLPVCEEVSDQCLSLPMGPYLSSDQQEEITRPLRQILSTSSDGKR